jgi:two-component system KDP operon response regulator KdpE
VGRIIVASRTAQQRKDLRIALERDGHMVAEAATTAQTIAEARTGDHDVIILDSNIDGSDSHNVCREIRPLSGVGIIVLLRSPGEHCRIDALNAGADDYLPEPFVLAELLARVRAIMRRVRRPEQTQDQIILDDRVIDLRSHKIEGPGSLITHLTPKEFLVLKCLIERDGELVTNRDLAQTVWNRDGCGDVEYVRIVISQLRRKLEPDHSRPTYIITERPRGYRFKLPALAGRQNHAPACESDSQAMVQ